MRKSFKLLLFIPALLILTSCVSTNKGFQSSSVISRNVQLDPIKADIKVDQSKKLTGESTSIYFLCFRIKGDNKYADGINFSSEAGITEKLWSFLNPFTLFKRIATGDAIGKVKKAASYKALENTDADFLMHPTYTITEKNFLIVYIYKAEVKGYSAKYQNFRTEKQKIIITNDGKEYVFPEK